MGKKDSTVEQIPDSATDLFAGLKDNESVHRHGLAIGPDFEGVDVDFLHVLVFDSNVTEGNQYAGQGIYVNGGLSPEGLDDFPAPNLLYHFLGITRRQGGNAKDNVFEDLG